MVIFPKSKINLGLRITGKRPDGYHDIETIFYPVGLCDALELVAGDEQQGKDILTVTGIVPEGEPENNLVIRAVKKLRERDPFTFLKIHLHKAIPSGAGLGGGSSDAAFVLKAINRFYELSNDNEDLKRIAFELGSDCPFFIDSQPAFASGRGEKLKPVDPVLEGLHILLINPGIVISTRDAYESCRPAAPSSDLTEIIKEPIGQWRHLIFNDFEKTLFKKYHRLEEIKTLLYSSGALYSSLSGSGSTVYGIFPDKPKVPDVLKDNVIYNGIL